MAGLGNKLNPNSVILTDRGYMSVAEAEYQHSLGNLNIIGRDGRAVNTQSPDAAALFEPSSKDVMKGDLDSLIGTKALEAGDIYKQLGGFGSTLDNRTGIQSAQEMFNQTYEEAMANEALANVLETQGVPDVVSAEDYFAKMTDTLKSLGIDPAQYGQLDAGETADLTQKTTDNELLGKVDMLDPSVTGIGGDETIVTDDPSGEWAKVDKTGDFGELLNKAMDIFGAYNREAIRGIVDVVNDRRMSVYDVATATGNTPESLNQAAAESGTAIENQDAPKSLTGGGVDPNAGTSANTPVQGGGKDKGAGAGTVSEREIGDGSTAKPIPPQPPEDPPEPPQPPEDPPEDPPEPPQPPVIITDDPETPQPPIIITDDPEPPKQPTTLMMAIQTGAINNTPIADSLLVTPQKFKLDNIPVGMFERFLRAAGGR